MKGKYFSLVENMYHKGQYRIEIHFDKLPLDYTEGSYGIIFARLLNLSYFDFLRYSRDICGATLYGKNSKYPYAVYENNEATKNLIEILNFRASEVLKRK